ncbi:hypothetical protein GGH12_000919 [Coemansia sp. RSA 1822]|nr:hypothetical protein LPJ58_002219 [Coemansia sp. RSA 1591]KAJ1763951.1 hypothetical protein LPJ69_002146 [Coemansia sp. RSA 1752]KAJ1776216.1 hypothetical protein LPJ54_003222 [Coemansia sp. RSA 1824]KAJ1784770.1 hypothetical protein LPJ67_004203 [Coemansia sp. RSA 1938]KAJ1785131.1 hypothetical protein LPJ62_004357 [Coemansia sp. RSA 2167]KAJ1804621.1 hypothetical protein LPJ77_004672 [Coemansia sp. RSA 2523]KAJ1859071.1 hypothetical protein LPJ76_000463 [Coemansia sp. RSA 638]KAJ2123212
MSARAFSKSLKELRIHFSQTSAASNGLRDFIVKAYPGLKQANPGLPILIREASGVESRIIARFEQGRERKVVVDSLSASDVEQKFNALVSELK